MILCKYSRCFCCSVRKIANCNRATVALLFGKSQLGLAPGHDAAFSETKELREPNCKTSCDDANDFLCPPPFHPRALSSSTFVNLGLSSKPCEIKNLWKSRWHPEVPISLPP